MNERTLFPLIDKLARCHQLTEAEYAQLIRFRTPETAARLAALARTAREAVYGTEVYTRGLIEVSNFCRNDCYYCGIRKSNQACEDRAFSVPRVCRLLRTIKSDYPDCAVTLSLGEMERADYQALYDAGADRYLLRHETADPDHYATLHPAALSFDHRIQCLRDLKDIGYQVGCGFLVGSPGQTPEILAKDLKFVEEFQPAMCGIGPFIPQQDTPLRNEAPGTAELTVYLLSILRLIQPNLLLPATTALGTIQPNGRELGLAAGANVVMPNLSPLSVRKKYALYDGKICTGEEGAQCVGCLQGRVASVGYTLVSSRGDIRTI